MALTKSSADRPQAPAAAIEVWEHVESVTATYRVTIIAHHGARLLDTFDPPDRRYTIGHALSRSIRQKISIVCADLHAPESLLFDQPFTDLDLSDDRANQKSTDDGVRNGVAVIELSYLLGMVQDLWTLVLTFQHGKSQIFAKLVAVQGGGEDSGRSDGIVEHACFEIAGQQAQQWL